MARSSPAELLERGFEAPSRALVGREDELRPAGSEPLECISRLLVPEEAAIGGDDEKFWIGLSRRTLRFGRSSLGEDGGRATR